MSKDPIIERLHKTKAVLENLNKEINNPIDIHISDYSLHDYKNLRQVIIEAGQKLEYDLSKLHLLYANFNYQALDSLLSVVENSMNGLIAISRLNIGCGMTLSARKITIEKLNTIYTATVQFINHFEQSYKSKEKKLSPNIVGAAMDSCKDLQKLPTSNKLAIQSDLFSKMVIYKDIITEFTEMIEENEHGEKDEFSEFLDELGDGLNDILDYSLSEDDINRVKKGIQCVNSLGKYFQQCVRIITKQPDLIPMETIPIMDTFTTCCIQLGSDVDEFAVCFYDGCPKESTLHNMDIVTKQLIQLNETTLLFCDKESDLYVSLLKCYNSVLEHFEQLKSLLN